MRQFKDILRFEYLGYVRTKGYIITTVVLLVLILGGAFVPNIVSLFRRDAAAEAVTDVREAAPEKRALLSDPAGIYTDELLALYMPGFEWFRVDYIDNAEELVYNEYYDLVLFIDGLSFTAYEQSVGLIFQGSEHIIHHMVRDVNQRLMLAEHGLTAEETAEVLYAMVSGTMNIVGADYTQTFWIGYVMLMLIFISVLVYGQFVSTSVVIEKSSKAMELLITSAKPLQLMMGKVFGVGLAGLTQLVAILAVALIAINLNNAAWYEFSPAVHQILSMSVTPGFFGITILFFVFGFFSFAFVLAGFACTVSRMEELNNIVIIPTLIAVAAFYVAIMGSMTPDMAYVRVTSIVPLLSPMVMMVRLSVTTVPAWEILAACAVNIATILFAGLVCSKIYRVGVMLYGNKPKLRDIVRLAFK